MGQQRDWGRVRTDEGLPLASRAGVAGELEVGLEAELSGEGRERLTVVLRAVGKGDALEEGLERAKPVSAPPLSFPREEAKARTSTKNWASKSEGVESKGLPWMRGAMWSCAATECEARRSTTSAGLKPASPMRFRILSVGSDGSGIRPSGETMEWLERPARNLRRGPPRQLLTATAPANSMLEKGGRNAPVSGRRAGGGRGDPQVAEGDVVRQREGALLVGDLVEADAGGEAGLDLGEGHDGAVWAGCESLCSIRKFVSGTHHNRPWGRSRARTRCSRGR